MRGYETLPEDFTLAGEVITAEGLARPWPLPPLARQRRELALEWTPPGVGAFDLVVRARRGGAVVDEARRTVIVEPQAAERLAVGINQQLLTELAEKSGGFYLPWSDADRLPELLPGCLETHQQVSLTPLTRTAGFFALLFLALLADWLARRRLGLP